MLELILGVGVGLLLGSRAGWPVAAGAVAGVPIGLLLYLGSCLIWDAWPCWWPWCTARHRTRSGPGKRVRRRRPCRRCGGSGLVDRWGTRLLNRE